jgi:mannose-6-phosphate isomerase-like protein (cupin superfamily)
MKRTIYNPIIQDSITFVKTSEETNGEFSEALLTVMPGGGNPIHIHSEFTETFTPTRGAIGVTNGKKKLIVKEGESVTIEKGVRHNFFNPTNNPCEVQVVLRPGHSGFENALRIAYGLACDGKTDSRGMPKDFSVIGLIFEMGNSRVPGILSLINPIMKMLARRARKKGLEKKLINTYCR